VVPGARYAQAAGLEVHGRPVERIGFTRAQAREAEQANQCSLVGPRGPDDRLDLRLAESLALHVVLVLPALKGPEALHHVALHELTLEREEQDGPSWRVASG
jgi:hypothetical protein